MFFKMLFIFNHARRKANKKNYIFNKTIMYNSLQRTHALGAGEEALIVGNDTASSLLC